MIRIHSTDHPVRTAGGLVAMGSDGRTRTGTTVMKSNAKKLRRLRSKTRVGQASQEPRLSAFLTLFEKFEAEIR